jgi:acylphosphatase
LKVQYDIRVTGRVQGVGFRYATSSRARELGLKGWVKNLPDGSVRIMVQGDTERCHTFIAWCRSGPGYSWVDKVEITEVEPDELRHFDMIR